MKLKKITAVALAAFSVASGSSAFADGLKSDIKTPTVKPVPTHKVPKKRGHGLGITLGAFAGLYATYRIACDSCKAVCLANYASDDFKAYKECSAKNDDIMLKNECLFKVRCCIDEWDAYRICCAMMAYLRSKNKHVSDKKATESRKIDFGEVKNTLVDWVEWLKIYAKTTFVFDQECKGVTIGNSTYTIDDEMMCIRETKVVNNTVYTYYHSPITGKCYCVVPTVDKK